MTKKLAESSDGMLFARGEVRRAFSETIGIRNHLYSFSASASNELDSRTFPQERRKPRKTHFRRLSPKHSSRAAFFRTFNNGPRGNTGELRQVWSHAQQNPVPKSSWLIVSARQSAARSPRGEFLLKADEE